MRDAFINAINTRQTTVQWMNALAENIQNWNTVGYREKQIGFKSYLDSAVMDKVMESARQGKALPAAPGNVYLEGNGYFMIRNDEGKVAYTRLGEFNFDGEGVYKSADGSKVQGYILNEKGEIMSGTRTVSNSDFEKAIQEGGALAIPTTEIKLWIDPDNGKYLGKYDEFEVKGDGILYGKANNGKDCTPLYKLAVMNFHNPQELFEYKQGQYLETEYSGRPVTGKAEIRSGLIELSNIDMKANITYWQQAKNQMEIANKLMSAHKQMISDALQILD